MAVLPANWPASGGNYHGTDQNNVETAINAIPAKAVATVVATSALPAGVYNNAAAGVGATFTVTATGTTTIDGHALVLNDLVLAVAQAGATQNGLYTVTVAGGGGVSTILTRATVMNGAADFPGSLVIVGGAGLSYANTVWLCTATGTPVIGATNLPFVQPQPTKRVTNDATSPTGLALNTDTFDVYKVSALANPTAITVSGNPVDRDGWTLVITDNGTVQPLNWSTSFAYMGVVGSLPGVTPPGRKMTLQFVYDADISKHVLTAVDTVGY